MRERFGPSYFYRCHIQYLGKDFFGFQRQTTLTSIQETIEKALTQITQKTPCLVLGAGRTDTGVHALHQECRLEIPVEIDPLKLLLSLNGILPDSIRILNLKKTTIKFHPQINVTSKEYHYYFHCSRQAMMPQLNQLVFHYPYDLDIMKMKMACQMLVGEHDFLEFSTKGSNVKSTVRTIFRAEIEELNGNFLNLNNEKNYYVFKVSGNGFLKQMIRLIMGTLLQIGRDKLTLQQLEATLNQGQALPFRLVVMPHGLHKACVVYQNENNGQ